MLGAALVRLASPQIPACPRSIYRIFLSHRDNRRRPAGASFFDVIFGHFSEYWRLSSSHFSSPGSVSGFDCVHRAFGLANPAVDALVRMDDEHVLAFVEAVDRADLDAVGELALDAVLVDDVGHALSSLRPWIRRSVGWPLLPQMGKRLQAASAHSAQPCHSLLREPVGQAPVALAGPAATGSRSAWRRVQPSGLRRSRNTS